MLCVHAPNTPTDAHFTDAGGHRRTAGHDGVCKLLSFPSGESVATLKGHAGAVRCSAAPSSLMALPSGSIYDCAWSGGVLASCSHDHTANLWDAASGKVGRCCEGVC